MEATPLYYRHRRVRLAYELIENSGRRFVKFSNWLNGVDLLFNEPAFQHIKLRCNDFKNI
ncbi:hypothetical protein GCM10027185_18500 [Spirosoma pulveris]